MIKEAQQMSNKEIHIKTHNQIVRSQREGKNFESNKKKAICHIQRNKGERSHSLISKLIAKLQ